MKNLILLGVFAVLLSCTGYEDSYSRFLDIDIPKEVRKNWDSISDAENYVREKVEYEDTIKYNFKLYPDEILKKEKGNCNNRSIVLMAIIKKYFQKDSYYKEYYTNKEKTKGHAIIECGGNLYLNNIDNNYGNFTKLSLIDMIYKIEYEKNIK